MRANICKCLFQLERQNCYTKVSFLIAMGADKQKAAYVGDIQSKFRATYQWESTVLAKL